MNILVIGNMFDLAHVGQNELIKRIGGSIKTIEFKLQQGMMERM